MLAFFVLKNLKEGICYRMKIKLNPTWLFSE